MLVGVNVVDSWLIEATMVINCKTGRTPFVYLGIDGDKRWLNFFILLLCQTKSRLYGWKSTNVSLGGRLILLKFVYSLFRYISSIESILECFFWIVRILGKYLGSNRMIFVRVSKKVSLDGRVKVVLPFGFILGAFRVT